MEVLENIFPSFDQVREKIIKYNEPEKQDFVCPKCGAVGYWMTSRNMLCCKQCNKQVSLKRNSEAANSKKSLETWHAGLKLFLCRESEEISIKTFKEKLGIAHQTATTWLKLFRKNLLIANTTNKISEGFVGFCNDFFPSNGRYSDQTLAIAVNYRSFDLSSEEYKNIHIRIIKNTPSAKENFIFTILRERTVLVGSAILYMDANDYNGLRLDNIRIINSYNGSAISIIIKQVENKLRNWINTNYNNNIISSPYLEGFLQEFVYLQKRKHLKDEQLRGFYDEYLTTFMKPKTNM